MMNLKIPIIVAPMAGGPNTVKQVTIASLNGALGSFGFSYTSPEMIDKTLQETKMILQQGGGKELMVNCNFFTWGLEQEPEEQDLIISMNSIKPFGPITSPKPPHHPSLNQQLEIIWKHAPKYLTFHFGPPEMEIFEKAKSLGIKVGVSCTNEQEAKELIEKPCDFIILQGIEAGGHRGTFSFDKYSSSRKLTKLTTTDTDDKLSALQLLERVKKLTSLPLVVAGGFMNGKQCKQALNQGATAIQMGTAFLTCQESGSTPLYKQTLLSHSIETTTKIEQQPDFVTYTHHFSGRPAQGLECEFTQKTRENQDLYLPFPIQNALTGGMRKQGLVNSSSFWCGWGVSQSRSLSTLQLLEKLVEEMK